MTFHEILESQFWDDDLKKGNTLFQTGPKCPKIQFLGIFRLTGNLNFRAKNTFI